MNTPLYSIIIPTYNSVGTLLPLLESLEEQRTENTEVIVVDDGSTDGTEEALQSFNLRYFKQAKRGGPAAARNRGAREALGEWFVFTDADTCYNDDTLEKIIQAIKESDGDAFVGTYAGHPANPGFMPRYKALWELITIDEQLLARGGSYIPYNAWAPRPGIVRRDAFEAVGGFSETFTGADLEDVEFGYRLIKEGFKIYFCPAIKIKHHYPATFWKEIRPFARRCRLWMTLERPKGFDAAGEGSLRQATIHMAGFSAAALLVPSLLFPVFLLPAALLMLYYFFGNSPFLYRAWKEEGAVFTLRAALCRWSHTLVMGVFAGLGLVQRIVKGRKHG
ncbi:MAG: glycosyltransferase [Candidatus Hydrogenedens sp.]|nr:glycosyltransferase [Candidatus Hydrogenedens sp.]